MSNFELMNQYNQQSTCENSAGYTDYTDYTDHMDHDFFNDSGIYADVDVTETVSQDWGGTHGFDGNPDHCVSHDDYD